MIYFLLMSTEWLVIYVVSTADYLARLFEAMRNKALATRMLATRIKQLGTNCIISVEEEEEEQQFMVLLCIADVVLISSTLK